jgi:Zn-finger nucleic acid-binding protein
VFVCPNCAFESFDADAIREDRCPRCHKVDREAIIKRFSDQLQALKRAAKEYGVTLPG